MPLAHTDLGFQRGHSGLQLPLCSGSRAQLPAKLCLTLPGRLQLRLQLQKLLQPAGICGCGQLTGATPLLLQRQRLPQRVGLGARRFQLLPMRRAVLLDALHRQLVLRLCTGGQRPASTAV